MLIFYICDINRKPTMRTVFKFFLITLLLTGLQASIHGQTVSREKKDSVLNSYITLPNSDIQIVPPPYFKPFVKDGKFGFMHDGAAASLSIEEISGTPYTVLVQGMTKENLESQGVKFMAKEEVKTRDLKDATIFLVSFRVKSKDGSQEIEYERLMLFTGTYNRTIWINANYPAVARAMLFNVFKESLLSVKFE